MARVHQFFEYYNNKRIHSILKMPPIQFRETYCLKK
ncbi:hypothetical protein COT52_02930 [candidate division WWE3 bacterium CG08_land_8_20_14_0_20_43_13]|uniref:Integrase catalytic domain-containing protein n=1 Tax=candidate division WWE3 bacterium CG08_land_8_20_14_0_20_43_13 TaxID=1975087 RepID=A0A2H0X6P0_UNCKA|nr:MAG: hypothetical protein COT52_02930 [candidate division WWE3 bacterium CG08_land_8_20_14_0_20_43_13]